MIILKIRPILSTEYEFFTKNKEYCIPVYNHFNIYEYPVRGWAVYENNYFSNIAGVVLGEPGAWYLYYAHEQKGVCKERIAVPRTAKYRMATLIEENPKC